MKVKESFHFVVGEDDIEPHSVDSEQRRVDVAFVEAHTSGFTRYVHDKLADRGVGVVVLLEEKIKEWVSLPHSIPPPLLPARYLGLNDFETVADLGVRDGQGGLRTRVRALLEAYDPETEYLVLLVGRHAFRLYRLQPETASPKDLSDIGPRRLN